VTEALDRADDASSDAALIAAVRRGDTNAYGVLYQRHLHAAKRAATCLATTAGEREDLVAEAFTRVLRVLRSGRGPTDEFRPYLLVTMRNTAINSTRRSPTLSLYADVPDAYLREATGDSVAAGSHSSVVAVAFSRLPPRWRMILWHTEIEGETPADIAPLLGMTPNGVAALAYRAREGLRQAYLGLHMPTVHRRDCRATADKLAAWVRRSISEPQNRKINAHLDRCTRCRNLASALSKVNSDLPTVLAPLLLSAPLAAGYLTTTTSSAAVVTAAATNSGVAGFSLLSAAQAAVTATTGKIGIAATIAAIATVTAVSSLPDAAYDGPAVPVPGMQVPGASQGTSSTAGQLDPATEGPRKTPEPSSGSNGSPAGGQGKDTIQEGGPANAKSGEQGTQPQRPSVTAKPPPSAAAPVRPTAPSPAEQPVFDSER
jgi:RNA polymerase sigma factor (sigma-70 family)